MSGELVMIAFGTLVADQKKYEQWAQAGILRCSENSTVITTDSGARSIAAGYNSIIDRVKNCPELEALVLLHEDTEITDPDFCVKVRARLHDTSVGLIGVIGARNVTHLAYWLGDIKGSVEESTRTVSGGPGPHEVDAIDGLLMVLSPWAVRTVRFDEATFTAFHGYDIDYSFAVRKGGRRVVADALDVIHHTKGNYGDVTQYLIASRAWREKWLSDASLRVRLSGQVRDWRMRLRLRRRAGPLDQTVRRLVKRSRSEAAS